MDVKIYDRVTISKNCPYENIIGKEAVVIGFSETTGRAICWFENLETCFEVGCGITLHNCGRTDSEYRGRCLYLDERSLIVEESWFWRLI